MREGVWWFNPDFKPAWWVENQDLVEQTHRDYIVGYTVKALSEPDLLAKR